jgi:phosphosulfolactate synthase
MKLSAFSRPQKPRGTGLNLLIDGGLPTHLFQDYIHSFATHIDGVKFGWGSGTATPDIDQKTACLREANIPFWFGGTAFEIAYKNNLLDKFVDWVKSHGATHFEVSDGAIELPREDRTKLIADLSQDFEVYTEVGSKDANVILSPSIWVELISSDFEAGAKKVILEGRESGAAGMYRKDGEVRYGLIDDIVFSGAKVENLIFEAPKKAQQVWFIQRFGRMCNLANIPFEAILNVETLRLGLRADTLDDPH